MASSPDRSNEFVVDSAATAGGAVVLAVRGELDISTAPDLESIVQLTLAEAPTRLILDLSETGFIDSGGLHSIIRARDHAIAADVAPLGLVVDNERHLDLLRLTGIDLDERLRITRSRDEALGTS